MNGIFISFEGIEGSGKSTQIKLLNDYLKESGHETTITREPGGTGISEEIRKIILDSRNTDMDPKVELFLYIAGRIEHVKDLIIPSIKNGLIVLCDRFFDSTVAYQGFGRGLDLNMIMGLNQYALEGLSPDLTFLLDIEPEKGLERIIKRGGNNRLDREKIDFYDKVRSGYLEIARNNPERVRIINAENEADAVFNEIKKIVREKLGEKNVP